MTKSPLLALVILLGLAGSASAGSALPCRATLQPADTQALRALGVDAANYDGDGARFCEVRAIIQEARRIQATRNATQRRSMLRQFQISRVPDDLKPFATSEGENNEVQMVDAIIIEVLSAGFPSTALA
jgi:hypothetical protein